MWVRPANLFAGPVLPCFPQAVSSSTPAPGNANLPIGVFMVVSPALAVMTAMLSFNLHVCVVAQPATPGATASPLARAPNSKSPTSPSLRRPSNFMAKPNSLPTPRGGETCHLRQLPPGAN